MYREEISNDRGARKGAVRSLKGTLWVGSGPVGSDPTRPSHASDVLKNVDFLLAITRTRKTGTERVLTGYPYRTRPVNEVSRSPYGRVPSVYGLRPIPVCLPKQHDVRDTVEGFLKRHQVTSSGGKCPQRLYCRKRLREKLNFEIKMKQQSGEQSASRHHIPQGYQNNNNIESQVTSINKDPAKKNRNLMLPANPVYGRVRVPRIRVYPYRTRPVGVEVQSGYGRVPYPYDGP
ncbi:hypothetical protein K438DRAFT_1945043 [Mycena galopus ATCC 62051]|nr:hypothetical protein K438DRAFT_1945043 [Mycena galopus ATCC 62051]